MPRVDTGCAILAGKAAKKDAKEDTSSEDTEEENEDKLGELGLKSRSEPNSLLHTSLNSRSGSKSRPALSGNVSGNQPGLQRRLSRHLVVNSDGNFNTELSRTPSMMLIDMDAFNTESEEHEKQVEDLERRRLNTMQRRMESGSLLEKMREITNTADPDGTCLLQGFNWESWRGGGGNWYGVVGSKVDMLAEMGVTDIWLPPVSQSVAPQGYLPSQLFNLDGSQYGSQEQLEALLEQMHAAGLRGVADIVINHRCGDKQDSQGRWNQFSTGMVHRPSFAGVMDWGGWAINLGDKFSDGSGEHHPGNLDGNFDAAPNIDHQNTKVQQSISIWLRWLRLQVGFDAWRFDFVKGYAAQYVGHYCKKSEPAWAVGELWGDMQYDNEGLCHNQDKHRQDLCNWINATDKQSTAFDFTTKGILQEACRNTQYWRLKDSNGKPPGLIGWMPKYAVTFLDNHDTGSTQRHWPFPDDKVLVGYAYILTHPGIPSLFWDHVMDWGEDHRRRIADLLKVRRSAGIKASSPVRIKCADHDLYLAEVGEPAALRVALGPRRPGNPDGNHWSMGPEGNGYHIWVRKAPKPPAAAPVTQAAAPKPAAAAAVPTPTAAAATATAAPQPVAAGREPSDEEVSIPHFEDITVDGKVITARKLQAMEANELEKLTQRLEPVVKAAQLVLKSKFS
mmetsp:Transcript_115692/g.258563  ORF Transcript_115692/g.258563 Transcript_115692/m.258563 type:complete len:675 (-) Transcript_115692:100-2124(-)